YVTVRLAGAGRVRRVVVDTSYFVGNAPGWISLHGLDRDGHSVEDADGLVELVARTPIQPDTRHVFEATSSDPVTHVRLDVFPDGGLARLRVLGELTEDGVASVRSAFSANPR
ncbi:MAG: allantoicase, partial [Actinomycetes bacterium]